MHFQQFAFCRVSSCSILFSTVCSVSRMFARYRRSSTLANCTNCSRSFSGQSASDGKDGRQEQSTLEIVSSARSWQAARRSPDSRFMVMFRSPAPAPWPLDRRKRPCMRSSARRRQLPKLLLSSWQYWSTSPCLNCSHSLWNSMKRYWVGSIAYMTTCRQFRFVKERSMASSQALPGLVRMLDMWETISCAMRPTAPRKC
mmetsp:Transcript_91978/g.249587  ORF Transcript_91978/g.249587 Transcript_91978/m.249587 type:complete len:200 (-) Transcript_91978:349-948(-)